jgi:hypothetical protein
MFRVVSAIALVFGVAMGTAQAAVVTPTTPVDFSFAIPSAQSFNSFGYDCGDPCLSGIPDSNWLDTDKSFGLDFGTSQGGDDLGTVYFVNPFGFPISNVGGPFFTAPTPAGGFIPASINVPGALTLFVRVFHFDDEFAINFLSIGNFEGTLAPPPPSEVPLPGALPLFAGGLALLAGLLRNRRQRPAAGREVVAAG